MPLLETLHVAAAVLWLGNFAVTGVWALRAYAHRDRTVFAFAAREILFTDLVFTLAFGAAVVITGLLLAGGIGIQPLRVFWTRTALEIVVACGVVWAAAMLPLETRMLALSRAGKPCAREFVAWNLVGWLLTAALLTVIYLMIARPV